MFEEYYKSVPDIDAYLKRIGLKQPIEPTLDNLRKLIYQHQCNVPFENVGIHITREDLSVKIDDLFEKIVVRKQGGCCYELNGLFYALLKNLGYDVSACLCKGRDHEGPYWMAMHRSTIVHLDGKRYYCDVGFGGGMPAEPILMEDGLVQHFEDGDYCMSFVNDTTWAVRQLKSESEYRDILFVNPHPFDIVDFVPLFFYGRSYDTHEFDFFKENLIMNIRIEDGMASLMNRNLRIRHFSKGKIEEIDLSDKEIFMDIMHKIFKFPMDDNVLKMYE